MSWFLFFFLAGLVILYLAALFALPVTPPSEQIAYVTWLMSAGGPLLHVTHRLSHANIVPTKNTLLADLPECNFTGYAPAPGLDPGAPYQGGDGRVHAGYPGQTFVASDGAAQIVSNLAVGPITMAGSLSVVVTAVGMTGSPITLAVPVLTTDSDHDIAEKVATVARANANIAAFFTVTVHDATVVFTRKVAAANDATMNVSLATGTATGLTAKPTAAQVRAGSVPGTFVADTAYIQFATDAAGTTLLWAQKLDQAVNFGAPGAGADLSLDYIYGA